MTLRPMSARTLRRRTRPADGEAGFTLVELVVTMAVMSIVATAMMAVAMRSFTTTSTITNRRDVLVDGRVAIDQMTKQLRQGESVDLTASDASTLTFSWLHRRRCRYDDRLAGHRDERSLHARAVARRRGALRAAGLAGPVQDSERYGLLGRPIHLRATRGRRRPGHDRPDLRDEHVDASTSCPTSNCGTWRAEEPMRNALLRAMHREEGYSLVISMLLMAIMMVLLAVSLDAGSSSLRQSSLSLEWSKALTVAEGGADAAVTLLGESRAATNSCAIGTSNVCNGVDGQYQVRWTTSGSTDRRHVGGLLPDRRRTRSSRARCRSPTSRSRRSSTRSSRRRRCRVQNNMTVMGDIYSAGDITVGNGANVCGSVHLFGRWRHPRCRTAQDRRRRTRRSVARASRGNVWTGGTGGITGRQRP